MEAMSPVRCSPVMAALSTLLRLSLTACAGPAAPTGTAPSDSQAQVEAVLADLDRREQVAQLIVVGVALTDLSPR